MAETATRRPQLAAEDVRVVADRMGREVIVIPDEVAIGLREQIKDGWKEIPDVGHGYSRPFPADSWVAQSTWTIMQAYADSAVPDGISTQARRPGMLSDADGARREREFARTGSQMVVSIVGESGWDDATRWWAGGAYAEHAHLHLPGTPSLSDRLSGNAIEYSG